MTKKILIIDDSDIIQDRLLLHLSEMADVTVTGQASNTKDGYELFYILNPDVIILDIHMPGESGIRLLEKIKRDSPGTVVIMLTNYPYQAYREHCRKLGADFFLDKCTEFEKIGRLIAG